MLDDWRGKSSLSRVTIVAVFKLGGDGEMLVCALNIRLPEKVTGTYGAVFALSYSN